MLKTLTATHRQYDRVSKVPRVSESTVWCAAARLREQFPDTPWLEASYRADRAYVAGHMHYFRLWGRVAHALREQCENRLRVLS